MKLAGVVRQEVALSIGLVPSQTIELDRFCIHPDFHKRNFASFLLGRLGRLVKADIPGVCTLVSFADSDQGHSGSIYKAANWKLAGVSRPGYLYRKPDGGIVHKKTAWNAAKVRGMSEKEYADFAGLTKESTGPKSKFIFSL
jgi:hypothetical protein